MKLQLRALYSVSTVLLLTSTALAFFQNTLLKEVGSKRAIGGKQKLQFKKVIPPPVTEASLHQSLALQCEAGGSPTPTIHWLFNGERIEQGALADIAEDDAVFEDKMTPRGEPLLRLGASKSRLFLDCVTEDLVGVYTCVAETPFQRIATDTELSIESAVPIGMDKRCLVKKSFSGEPARVFLWTHVRLEIEGADVQLFCRAEGSPAPHITWLDRSGKPIGKDNTNFEVLDNGDLLIRDISWKKNMGSYTCLAENALGSDKIHTFLYPTFV